MKWWRKTEAEREREKAARQESKPTEKSVVTHVTTDEPRRKGSQP